LVVMYLLFDRLFLLLLSLLLFFHNDAYNMLLADKIIED
jgi:hypothetical protein